MAKKKKRFLTQKFKQTIGASALTSGVLGTAAICFIPLDMGLSLAFLASGAVSGPVNALNGFNHDKKRKKMISYPNTAGQNLKAPIWAKEYQEKLQNKLDKLTRSQAKNYEHGLGLILEKHEALKTLQQLEEHITLVDENDQKLDGEILYVVHESDLKGPEGRFIQKLVDSKGNIHQPKPPKPQAFKL